MQKIPEVYQKVANNLKLDETGVFHGDPNPANFMLKEDVYIGAVFPKILMIV